MRLNATGRTRRPTRNRAIQRAIPTESSCQRPEREPQPGQARRIGVISVPTGANPGVAVDDGRTSLDPKLLRRLLRAKDRMDAASHEDWPVRRLAQVSNVSPAHFARSFKQAFGLPPHRYLLTRRIERAATLLRETGLPIAEIAFRTGWGSLGTFGRVFRDITGTSPGELRSGAGDAARSPALVPACVLGAAHRPDLNIAVSEKRRRLAAGTTLAVEPQEVA